MSGMAKEKIAELVVAGDALRRRGDAAGAARQYLAALAEDPEHYEANNNLGIIYLLSGRVMEAVGLLERAANHQPGRALAWLNLGNALIQSGDVPAAIDACRRALSADPNLEGAARNLAFFMTFDPSATPEAILEQHRQWASAFADPIATAAMHPNDRSPLRRIRVGYVSPDFREHAVAHFIEPLLRHHDPRQVEVFCYSDVNHPDPVTQRLRSFVGHWHATARVSDDELAAIIRAHQIDILVDLAGFTYGGRPLLFARKPAPVQIAYLGYPATTGMKAMDYRIVDVHTDPPPVVSGAEPAATEAFWTEKLVRLPRTFACYQPPSSAPQVGPLPASANGFITFASFAMLSKLNDPLIAIWSRILCEVPRSKLLMATGGLQEPALAERIRGRFTSDGIDSSRLELTGAMKFDDYLAAHQRIDILLDSFPVSGHTVSCHALWMGVPIVSLAGRSYQQRLGASLLNNLDLTDLLADSVERYVQIATQLAADLPRLSELRASLRPRMTASPICDAGSFARDVEAAYRTIWRVYCTNR